MVVVFDHHLDFLKTCIELIENALKLGFNTASKNKGLFKAVNGF